MLAFYRIRLILKGVALKLALSDDTCPSCLQPLGVEHVEVPPVEDRTQPKDRRRNVDLTYLSLIGADRRQIGTDRRAFSSGKVTVEHHTHAAMVCLNCGHEWSADTDMSLTASR